MRHLGNVDFHSDFGNSSWTLYRGDSKENHKYGKAQTLPVKQTAIYNFWKEHLAAAAASLLLPLSSWSVIIMFVRNRTQVNDNQSFVPVKKEDASILTDIKKKFCMILIWVFSRNYEYFECWFNFYAARQTLRFIFQKIYVRWVNFRSFCSENFVFKC